MTVLSGRVDSLSIDDKHAFSKKPASRIRLLAGLGVEGDAHAGDTVKHLSRMRVDPSQPNLRQVHLIHRELFDELADKGFQVGPGDLGENISTAGLDLLSMPTGTRLHLGDEALVEITGLRNPCGQIEDFQQGLLKAVLEKDIQKGVIRKTGVMAVVVVGGSVEPGDPIRVSLPPEPHQPLEPV